MKPLVIKSSSDTPRVVLDKENGIFEISGASLPENIFEFYDPILNWLKEYVEDPNEETNLQLKFDYLNSSSTKVLHNILRILEELFEKDIKVMATWYYDFGDFEMKEAGQEFYENTIIPFKFSENSEY